MDIFRFVLCVSKFWDQPRTSEFCNAQYICIDQRSTNIGVNSRDLFGISVSSSVLLGVCLGPSLPLISDDANKNRFSDVSFRFSPPHQHFHHLGQETSSSQAGIVINHGRAVPNEQQPPPPPSTQSQYWNSGGGGNSNPSAHTADFAGKKQQPPPPPPPHAITNFSSNLNQARDSKFLGRSHWVQSRTFILLGL